MFELLAFWNFFEGGLLKEVLCTGINKYNNKIERTIIFNSKNGKLYEYDSFKEKFVPQEKVKSVSENLGFPDNSRDTSPMALIHSRLSRASLISL